jgi:hypothetical protein
LQKCSILGFGSQILDFLDTDPHIIDEDTQPCSFQPNNFCYPTWRTKNTGTLKINNKYEKKVNVGQTLGEVVFAVLVVFDEEYSNRPECDTADPQAQYKVSEQTTEESSNSCVG